MGLAGSVCVPWAATFASLAALLLFLAVHHGYHESTSRHLVGLARGLQHSSPSLCDVGSPLHDQIQSDLAPFASGITQQMIEAAWEKYKDKTLPEPLQRMLIYDNKLYIKKERGAGAKSSLLPIRSYFMLLRVLCRYRVPNTEYVFSYGEIPLMHHNETEPLPVFSWAKTSSHWDIHVPRWGTAANPNTVPASFNASKWRALEDRAVWRGSTTGAMYKLSNWNVTKRSKLVAMCKRRPDLCDAQFTGLPQTEPDAAELIKQAFGVHSSTPMQELESRFKYLIVLGGNGNYTGSRSIDALKAAMTPLWVFTEQIEFFSLLLRPYEHYIPVAIDLEDLYERIEWARANPLLSERIARNGQAFANKYIVPDMVSAYMFTVLSEYARLQRFEPRVTPQHVQVRVKGDAMAARLVRLAGGYCPHFKLKHEKAAG